MIFVCKILKEFRFCLACNSYIRARYGNGRYLTNIYAYTVYVLLIDDFEIMESRSRFARGSEARDTVLVLSKLKK